MTVYEKRLVVEVLHAMKELVKTCPPLSMIPNLAPKLIHLKTAIEILGKATVSSPTEKE